MRFAPVRPVSLEQVTRIRSQRKKEKKEKKRRSLNVWHSDFDNKNQTFCPSLRAHIRNITLSVLSHR